MLNESLREFQLKICAGTASSAELKLWEEWIIQPYIQAQQLVSEKEIEHRLRIDMAKPDWESFLKQQQLIHYEEKGMGADDLYREAISSRPAGIFIRRWIAAIIIGVVLSTAAYLLLKKHKKESRQLAADEYEHIHSRSGEIMAYSLPEGTKVWGNANTSLRCVKEFGNDSRRVELNGEAWFDVAKDEQRPFIVLTDSS